MAITKLPLHPDIHYRAAILEDEGCTYIYGMEDPDYATLGHVPDYSAAT